MISKCRLMGLIGVVCLAVGAEGGDAVRPEWIWHSGGSAGDEVVVFRTTFSVPEAITGVISGATLQTVGESAAVEVRLDGRVLVDLEPYDPIAHMDVTDFVSPGDHELAVHCRGVAGPSAFFLHLQLHSAGTVVREIVTDSTWTCEGESVVSRGLVAAKLLVDRERKVAVAASDNYDQWKLAGGGTDEIDSARFETTPGFEIQRVRQAQPNEDSWVSMAIDSNGRVLVAKEKQGLLRMRLSEDGGRVETVEVIDDSLKECRGLLLVEDVSLGQDVLYANANNSKGLYRLTPDGNDGFNAPELVYASSGGVGHGRNDLSLGPDGKIYCIHGDSVDLPDTTLDWTSPLRDARNGKKTSEGHLIRVDPADGEVEVVAAGLRNPFGIDFNRDGDVFTYDADAEYDMGSSWYRPTRVSHLVPGGDYGWRGVTKTWPPYFPDHADNARSNLDIGKGSPTAVKFGTRSHFPQPYRDALFILDWTYGRIIAVHPVPCGASYRMMGETFLQGRPLNVTDLDFGPDGAMYFVTGGRKTQSALYRVQYVGDQPTESREPTQQQIAREAFAVESRQRRVALEAALLRTPSRVETEMQIDPRMIIAGLSDADPWIRHAARNVLERNIELADELLGREMNLDAKLEVLLVNCRALRHDDDRVDHASLLSALDELSLASATRSQKLAALQCHWLLLESGRAGSELPHDSTKNLATLYPDRSFVVNRLLSELLARSADDTVVRKSIALMRQTSDPVERFHYLYVLRNVENGWTDELRTEYFMQLAAAKHFVRGEGMNTFLAKIHEEAIGSLAAEERDHWNGFLEELSQPVEVLPPSKTRSFVREWTVDEIMQSIGSEQGDAQRGRQIFAEAACVNCHRHGSQGTFVGPDLSSVSRRFGRRDLLVSIVHPSRVIAGKYQSIQVLTSDGETYLGQVALGGDYRSTKLRLAIDPQQPSKVIEIEKADIEWERASPVSWMPAGLLDTFNAGEIRDLLAFLQSGG